jgi:hypothetical protein
MVKRAKKLAGTAKTAKQQQDLQKMSLLFNAIIDKNISAGAKTLLAKDWEVKLKENNIERLAMGLDTRGKKIKPLKPETRFAKRMVARGKWHLKNTTELITTGAANYGRNRGRTLSSMQAKVTFKILKGAISATIRYFAKDEDSNAIDGYLKKRYQRYYYGGLAPLTTKRGQTELKKLTDSMEKIFRIKLIK